METDTTRVEANPGKARTEAEEITYYTATQFQLMWWRFRKHRLAILGSSVLGLFLIVMLFAEFLVPTSPFTRDTDYALGPPQRLHFFDDDGVFHLRPFAYSVQSVRNPETFRLEYQVDTSVKRPLHFFVIFPYSTPSFLISNVQGCSMGPNSWNVSCPERSSTE